MVFFGKRGKNMSPKREVTKEGGRCQKEDKGQLPKSEGKNCVVAGV